MLSTARPLALVVTSTLPRWQNDTEPRFILDLCQALAARYRVRVLAPHCRGAARDERFGDVEIRRFRYFADWGEVLAYEGGILPKLRQRPWLWALVPIFMLAQTLVLVRMLRSEPVALVHAHWLIPQGVVARAAVALSGRRVPLICTAHGTDVHGLRGGLARALQRWVARGCARIGVVSAALGEELARRGVPAAKLRELPMGVTLPAPAASQSARDPDLVAFAGRVVESKGVGVLLDAFQRVQRERPATRLVVAGAGTHLQRFKHEAAVLGLAECVAFRGALPHADVLNLFAHAAVAVMPSIEEEGLGLTMLEAMAAGCPLIASDLPAVRGVIRDGENGWRVAPRDVDALARALRRTLDDRARSASVGAAGRCDVKARYSWDAVAATHAAVYAEVMAGDDAVLAARGALKDQP